MLLRGHWSLALVLSLAAAATACSSTDAGDLLDAPVDPGEGGQEDEPNAPLPPADLGPTPDPEADASAPDASGDAAKPETCTVLAVPEAEYLRYGLHPRASDALRSISVASSRITQTIGSAAASAGTHAQDGTADGKPYSAAVDLSVRDMSDAQVSVFLDKLTEVGFVAYLRKPGADGWPASEARHVHAVWVGAPMKLSLRNQVRDWRVGKNALASHTTYKFKTWSQCWRDAIWAKYLTANPATN